MTKLFNLKNRKGFTLIELVISITIISILASFLMSNFVGVRQRSRDGQRKSDLKQIQSALEQYRADNSSYPNALPSCGNSFEQNTTTYMSKLPCDPVSKESYIYSSTGLTYFIYACLENGSDQNKDSTNQPGCDVASFTVRNP